MWNLTDMESRVYIDSEMQAAWIDPYKNCQPVLWLVDSDMWSQKGFLELGPEEWAISQA